MIQKHEAPETVPSEPSFIVCRMYRTFTTLARIQLWIVLITFTTLLYFSARLDQIYDNAVASEVTVCGKKTGLSESIMDRIEERIRCRLTFAFPRNQPVIQLQNDRRTFNLTHDLSGAVGLGNFMFMTATTFGLAASSGRTPVFMEPHPHMAKFLHSFPVFDQKPPAGSIPKHRVEAAGIYETSLPRKLAVNNTAAPVKRIITLAGFLQSWRYFHHIRDELFYRFVFKPSIYTQVTQELNTKLTKYMKDTNRSPRMIIGIHVRRGDLLDPIPHRYGHTVATPRYLLRMTSRLNSQYPNSVFAVVSNDLPYCRTILRNLDNVLYMDGNNTAEVDLALLTLMDHLILSVGTFGWWGAYLSEAGEVYYYKHWPRRVTPMSREYKKTDYFFPTWIGAD
ncbi:galactoside alpha-(1,2)-fucosyltransferase 2-like [Paramacrobiotus metropolitanus]|uniref:galactoside alpha-(1,2)-fucosyltransferase 2-like n=1 Tax=Paramacrobiotus metropolitanus TaxID=2943436 RepID=UPI0024456BB0|nr:galactoside alpha-(1,2)-fucosyltransferase 2-like [Paramacrobiotus metropolitanus]